MRNKPQDVISERKRLKAALDESQTRLRLLFEASAEAICLFDESGILECNPATMRLFHFISREDFVGVHLTAFSPPIQPGGEDSLTLGRKLIIDAFKKGSHRFDWQYRSLDGCVFDADVVLTRIERNGKPVFFSSIRNITERKLAEAQLQASEKRLQLVLQATKDGIWDWDIKSDTVFMSPRHHEITGHAPEEFSGTLSNNVMVAVHPDDRDLALKTMKEQLAGCENAASLDFRLLDNAGNIKWVVSRGQVVERHADGTPLRVVGTLTDITKRKQGELALQASEASMKALLDSSPYMMWMKDTEGCYLGVNQRFVRSTEKRCTEEIIGKTDLDIYPQERAVRYRAQDSEVMSSRQQTLIEEPDFVHGRHYWMETFRTPVVDKDGRVLGTVGFSRDVTARREGERRRQEQEVEYRNALVREVHHRIKNNLQSVASLLHRALGKQRDLDPALDTAITQVKAIAVVHGLQSVDGDDIIRLANTLETICKATQEQMRYPLEVQIDKGTCRMRIARNEAVAIALILNELLLNAVKHSPENGPAAEVKLSQEGDRARISIRNARKGPGSFDIATGAGLNTGLRLLRSLMPENGATLSYAAEGEAFMVTQLVLTAPVIELTELTELTEQCEAS